MKDSGVTIVSWDFTVMALSAVSCENTDLCVHIKTPGAPPFLPPPPHTHLQSAAKALALPDSPDRTLLGLCLHAICQQASTRAKGCRSTLGWRRNEEGRPRGSWR